MCILLALFSCNCAPARTRSGVVVGGVFAWYFHYRASGLATERSRSHFARVQCVHLLLKFVKKVKVYIKNHIQNMEFLKIPNQYHDVNQMDYH